MIFNNSAILSHQYYKNIVSTIQNAFIKVNYPLQDLEQTLKQLDTQSATDMADGLEKDAKTLLLTTAQPYMIIEFDYKNKINITGKLESSVSYTLSVMDAYTNREFVGSYINRLLRPTKERCHEEIRRG